MSLIPRICYFMTGLGDDEVGRATGVPGCRGTPGWNARVLGGVEYKE